MTWLDWTILGLVLLGLVLGVRRGPLATMLLVVGLLLSFGFAAQAYPLLSNRIVLPGSPGWTALAAYFAIFVVSLAVIAGIVGFAVRRPDRPQVGPTFVAGVLGLLYGAGLAAVILVGLLASPVADRIRTDVSESVVAPYVAQGARAVILTITSVVPGFPRLGPGGARF